MVDCLTAPVFSNDTDMLSNKVAKLTHFYLNSWGEQWLSGRLLDSRPKSLGFKSHLPHCVVVLEQDTFILA